MINIKIIKMANPKTNFSKKQIKEGYKILKEIDLEIDTDWKSTNSDW